jgi:hypothetical protein
VLRPLAWILIAAVAAVFLLPTIAYFALQARFDSRDRLSGKEALLVAFACGAICSICSFAAGAALLGYATGGELCWRPSRYAGRYCTSFAKGPLQHLLALWFLWTMFWLGLVILIALARAYLADEP